MSLDLSELRALEQRATQGEWMVQDGCSWRRIGTHFHDGDVLRPAVHPRDNWPDLEASDGKRDYNLRLIVALRNAAPELLDAYAERDRLREALRERGVDVDGLRWRL